MGNARRSHPGCVMEEGQVETEPNGRICVSPCPLSFGDRQLLVRKKYSYIGLQDHLQPFDASSLRDGRYDVVHH